MRFSKKSGGLSFLGPEILAFSRHCLANFQPILDCFIPNRKLKYENSDNIKADCVKTVVLNLGQIKQITFWDTWYTSWFTCQIPKSDCLTHVIESRNVFYTHGRQHFIIRRAEMLKVLNYFDGEFL